MPAGPGSGAEERGGTGQCGVIACATLVPVTAIDVGILEAFVCMRKSTKNVPVSPPGDASKPKLGGSVAVGVFDPLSVQVEDP